MGDTTIWFVLLAVCLVVPGSMALFLRLTQKDFPYSKDPPFPTPPPSSQELLNKIKELEKKMEEKGKDLEEKHRLEDQKDLEEVERKQPPPGANLDDLLKYVDDVLRRQRK